eukprot:TRINITY_DN90_c1_g1_i1.p1 TRINITY_DN90_c1_g1~~TRINITY_DN90_c1_g1_i1.p1  ORF type:complete len:246 (-),score=36.18 TRINITY_DN90_c1_g1_i1:1207-1944(-)
MQPRKKVEPRENQASENQCPQCFGYSLFEDWKEGNRVCHQCGLVTESHLLSMDDDTPFSKEGDGSKGLARVGPMEFCFPTASKFPAVKASVDPEDAQTVPQDIESPDTLETVPQVSTKKLDAIVSKLHRVCDALGLTFDTRSYSLSLVSDVYCKNRHRFKTAEREQAFVGACVLRGCRDTAIPVTSSQVANAANSTIRDIVQIEKIISSVVPRKSTADSVAASMVSEQSSSKLSRKGHFHLMKSS